MKSITSNTRSFLIFSFFYICLSYFNIKAKDTFIRNSASNDVTILTYSDIFNSTNIVLTYFSFNTDWSNNYYWTIGDGFRGPRGITTKNVLSSQTVLDNSKSLLENHYINKNNNCGLNSAILY